MTNHCFDIRTPMRRQVASFGVYLFLLVLLIVSVPLGEVSVLVLAVLCALILILTAGMYMTIMLRFRVNGNAITIRTQLGKAYTVTCRDIVTVSCSQCESTRQGIQFFITVTTEQNEFTVDGRKEGFDTFACYLLDQLESGEIREFAVSDSCKQTLKQYGQGVYAPKKR